MRRPPALPLADVAELAPAARRAALVRSALAACVLVLVAAAFAAAPAGSVAPAAAGDRGTIAVLDVSGSITAHGSDQIQRSLGDLIARAGPNGHLGLVLFSDVAMEALPPTAPAGALQPFRRYFIPLRKGHRRGFHGGPRYTPATANNAFRQSPWSVAFSGGTSISTGLAEAQAALRRAGMRGGRVVLLSDLVDSPQDTPALRRQLTAYANDPDLDLEVRLLSSGMAQPLDLYRRILGDGAVRPAKTGPPPPLPTPDRRPPPVWLIALAALAAAALAANELVNVPLRWRRPAPLEAVA